MRRRDILKLGAATAAGIATGGSATAQTKPAALATMTWGGNWAKALRTGTDEKFEQITGIKVLQDQSNPVQRITKLKVNLENQIFDAVQLPDTLVPLAIKQGVLEKIDRNSPRLSNLKDVYPQFIHDHWVVQMFTAIGIGYNEKLVKTPPTSYADLWKPEYKGRIVLPDIAHSIGPYIIPIGAMAAGKPMSDSEAGFEMLKRMVDQRPIWTNNTDGMMNAFQNEEAVIGLKYRSHTYLLRDKGVPAQWCFPKEGAIALEWGWSIAKNTKNKEWAETYINVTLDPAGQVHFTDYANYPGSNKKMLDLLTPKQKERAELSEDQLNRMVRLDHEYMSDHRSEWTERWNRIVAGS
jgi:spermidine/putrescine-binding protein